MTHHRFHKRHRSRFSGLALALLLGALRAGAQEITLSDAPRNLQLFARDPQDSAEVSFAGTVNAAGHDSVRLEIFRGGALWSVDRGGLVYSSGVAPFRLSGRIHAELSEYAARFYLDGSLVAARDSLVCGDVFLINGQSNAQAGGQGTATQQSEWFRSFGTSHPDPQVCAADSSWDLAQGHATFTHAAVGVWGQSLGLSLVGAFRVPVAILNGAVAGTQIVEHERNDSDPTNLQTIYGRLLWRARKAGVARNIRAILWHQGESDTGSGQWPYYQARFDALWNAWHEDYGPLEKVYAFQIRPGCGYEGQCELREIQRTLPQFFPDLELMSTMGIGGHDGCHYTDAGYRQMAGWIFRLVARDLYGSSDTWCITPPNVLSASYTTADHREIRVDFDSEVVWPPDSLGVSMKDYFFLDEEWSTVDSGRVDANGRTIVLTLRGPSRAVRIGYLPNLSYLGPPWSTYEGPWIRNPRGVGALSFWGVPIPEAANVGEEPPRLIGCSPNPSARAARIDFSLGTPQAIRIDVFDAGGRCVRTLADRWFPAGNQVVTWDGEDRAGNPAAAGAYLYRLLGRNESRTGRLTIVR
jgi:hypothetical protein